MYRKMENINKDMLVFNTAALMVGQKHSDEFHDCMLLNAAATVNLFYSAVICIQMRVKLTGNVTKQYTSLIPAFRRQNDEEQLNSTYFVNKLF